MSIQRTQPPTPIFNFISYGHTKHPDILNFLSLTVHAAQLNLSLTVRAAQLFLSLTVRATQLNLKITVKSFF